MAFPVFFLPCLCSCLLAPICKSFIWSLVQNLLKLITIVFTNRMIFPDHLHCFNPRTAHALLWSGGGVLRDECLPRLWRVEHKGTSSWSLEVGEAATGAAGAGTPTGHGGSFCSLLPPGIARVCGLTAAGHASLFQDNQQVITVKILSHGHSLIITTESLLWGEKRLTLLTNLYLFNKNRQIGYVLKKIGGRKSAHKYTWAHQHLNPCL